MVESNRSLLAQFPEDEQTVRELAANNASFDALCQEYENVAKLLAEFELEVKRLRQLRAWLEEALLTGIEGQPPQ